jgi:hypothetical protein
MWQIPAMFADGGSVSGITDASYMFQDYLNNLSWLFIRTLSGW